MFISFRFRLPNGLEDHIGESRGQLNIMSQPIEANHFTSTKEETKLKFKRQNAIICITRKNSSIYIFK